MPRPSEALIYVNDDGSARELTDVEKEYVDTDFLPFDGARPYMKSRYEQRTPSGALRGYLQRSLLPPDVPVKPAPPPEPRATTPEAVAASNLDVIRKHRPE